MTIDLEELKRLAQAATPGPWYAGEKERWQMADGRFIRTSVDKSGTALVLVGNSNADFIAAANPAAVRALIERVERAEKERDVLAGQVEGVKSVLADERANARARLSTLEALARKGLEAYHKGSGCPFAHDVKPGESTECEHQECREWAAALEEGK